MKGGREVKRLAVHCFIILLVFTSFNHSVLCTFNSPSSPILPLFHLQHPWQSLFSCLFFPLYSHNFLCPMQGIQSFLQLLFLCFCPRSSSSSSSSSFSSTWGTPRSQRRWSISILPLGFLSQVWGRPGLLSPSGSEHHYWLPHGSHPDHQQRLKSPASRCASGLPGQSRRRKFTSWNEE